MKRKQWFLFLLTIVPLGLFIAVRQAATWQPQLITKTEFEARQSAEKSRPDFRENEGLNANQKRMKRLANSKGWTIEAVSGDGRQLLVSGKSTKYCYSAAVLSADDGRVLARLDPPTNKFCGEWGDAQFSPDNRLISFSQFEVSATQVFDSRTGKRLWSGQYWGERFRFSPDGRFAALPDVNRKPLSVREARSGRELRRLPLRYPTERWEFSRDGRFLLAEVAPGEFRQLRLR